MKKMMKKLALLTAMAIAFAMPMSVYCAAEDAGYLESPRRDDPDLPSPTPIPDITVTPIPTPTDIPTPTPGPTVRPDDPDFPTPGPHKDHNDEPSQPDSNTAPQTGESDFMGTAVFSAVLCALIAAFAGRKVIK